MKDEILHGWSVTSMTKNLIQKAGNSELSGRIHKSAEDELDDRSSFYCIMQRED